MKKVFFLLGLAMIIALGGCKKEKATGGDEALSCEITSPKDGAEFSITEDIIVTVETKSATGTIVAVTVYFDDLLCATVTEAPYTLTILSEFLAVGPHTIKAEVFDNVAEQAEASITVNIVGAADESPDFVTFADGEIPDSWKTNTWVVDVALGYDDNYSLRSDNPISAVLTNKTLNTPGYVEFYTRGEEFDLYIDGETAQALSSAPAGNWTKWIYDFKKGRHSFRWENTYGSVVYLDAIKFAAAELPKVTTNATVTDISAISATSGGNVTNNGNSPVTARGVCWSTSENPTIEDEKTIDGSETGSFTSHITGLERSTMYYVRAYVTNGVGTTYGEQITFITNSTIAIGDKCLGGIIAYIDDTGEHGLIAAPSDQSTGIRWYNGSYITTGATGTAIGTGKSNTDKIVQVQGNGNYAAKLCDDLVIDGYGDWYLPSKGELNELYKNRDVIGGFGTSYYWSSSEYTNYEAWCQYFGSGRQDESSKGNTWKVRAVRAF